ncbi:transcription elongation factor A N-terminal and central domain-containing protein [Lepisosteus oculatus]|uniref:transcription elongation factor A N-terminal and central domain-containing protein n=1 Tax=Lepisosteus oculatus TaxID=7918 RepID=UPI0035F503E0
MMDTQGIICHTRQIEKRLHEQNHQDIMLLLEELEMAHITLEQLQQTDIAKVVYRVCKTCQGTLVKKKAKVLLSKWKKLFTNPWCKASYHLAGKGPDEKNSTRGPHTEKNPSCCQSEINETHCSQCGQLEGNESFISEKDKAKETNEATQHNLFHCVASRGEVLKEDEFGSAISKNENKSDLSRLENNGNTPAVRSQPGTVENAGHDTSGVTLEKVQPSKIPLRSKCIQLLFQALIPEGAEHTESAGNCQEVACAIEEHVFILHGKNERKYKSFIRSKVSNLRNPKTPHWRQNLLGGQLSPKVFSEMSVMELASDELKQMRSAYIESAINEHQLPQGVGGTQTDKIKCRRCERFDCTVTLISRGTLFLPSWVRNGTPDEQMMTFVICNKCGEKWYNSGWICL